MKVFKIVTITLLCLLVAILFAGGGHGTYIPAKIIFPFTMILAEFNKEISFFDFMIAFFQIPIYNLILKKRPNLKYLLIGIHLFAVILCFYFNNDIF